MSTMRRFFLALLLIGFSNVHAATIPDVYSDSLGSGWGNWSWSISLNTSATTAFKGSYSAGVTYNTAWSGFAPGAGANFDTTGYKHLTFAVYNSSNGGNLYLFAANSGNTNGTALALASYSPTGTIPAGQWTWIRVPIASLGLGSNPVLSYFAIQSANAGAVVYFDEIKFEAGLKLYEGVHAQTGPGSQLWYWGANVSQPSSLGDYWIDVAATQSWGGIQLQEKIGNGYAPYSDYGALTVVFKKTLSNQNIYVSLVNDTNTVLGTVALSTNYIPTNLQPLTTNKWYRVIIPLSHFYNGYYTIGGVVFSSDIAGTFSVDDVRIIQKMKWPVQGVGINVFNGGYHFGESWLYGCSNGATKLHNGADYHDNAAYGGTQIYAAARGIVKLAQTQSGGWGDAVVIQHEGGLTTSYLHLVKASGIVVDAEVQKGTPLGTTANISGGSHLHFGIRVSDFDAVVSQSGALPFAATCDGYPTFPSSFLNPEQMDWEN